MILQRREVLLSARGSRAVRGGDDCWGTKGIVEAHISKSRYGAPDLGAGAGSRNNWVSREVAFSGVKSFGPAFRRALERLWGGK